MHKRLIIGALALTTLGLATACEPTTDAAPPAHAATPNDADTDRLAMDIVWQTSRADVCEPYNELRGKLSRDVLNDFMVGKFEEGAGRRLTGALRAHFVALLESC